MKPNRKITYLSRVLLLVEQKNQSVFDVTIGNKNCNYDRVIADCAIDGSVFGFS